MEQLGLADARRTRVETLRALRSSPWARSLPVVLADALDAIVIAAEAGDDARAATLFEEHVDTLTAHARRWAEQDVAPRLDGEHDAVTAMVGSNLAGFVAVQHADDFTVWHDPDTVDAETVRRVVPGFDRARVVRGSFGAALVAGPAVARRLAASRSRLRRGHGHRGGSGRRARTGRVRAGCSPGRSRPRRRADDDEHHGVALTGQRRR